MSAIEFLAPAGKTFSVQLYDPTTGAAIGTPITGVTDSVTPTRYRADTAAVAGVVFVVATTTNLRVAGYANLSDPYAITDHSPVLDLTDVNLINLRTQIDAAIAGAELTVKNFLDTEGDIKPIAPPAGAAFQLEADTSAIASDVYSKLAGGRSTLLSGPTSAAGPIDQVKTVDLSLTVPLTLPADSELVWFMRCHPDAPNAYLVASKTAGLTQLMTSTSPTANQASVTRNANNVAILIKAAALSQLPSETVACELRERTAAGAEISRHEVEITLRHSAGRN